MKNFFRNGFVYAVFAILISCSPSQSHEVAEVEILYVPLEEKVHFMEICSDSIFESVEYIPLETIDESLLSDIRELSVKILNDTIYVWDNGQQELMRYDETGRYMGKLSRRGTGPGEYIQVWDFLVLDTTVCVLESKNILFYKKSDFSYLYSISLPVRGVRLNKHGNLLYLFSGNRSAEKYNMYVIDIETGEIKNRYHEFDDKVRGVFYSTQTFNRSGAYNYYFMQYDYCIYEALPTGKQVVYKLDFGKENMFDEHFLSMSDSEKQNFLRKQYPDVRSLKNKKICGIDDLYFSDSIIFFTFVLGVSPYCYVQINGNMPKVGYISTSKKFPLASNIIQYTDDMYMYCLENAFSICDWKERFSDAEWTKSFPSKLKSDDNPVLCRYKWKIKNQE